MAAHRHGIKEAIVPRENEKDLPDIPEDIRNDHEAAFRRVDGRGSEDRAGAGDCGAADAGRTPGVEVAAQPEENRRALRSDRRSGRQPEPTGSIW